MCGLAGLARLDGGPLAEGSRRVLESMARSLSHRGPDGTRILFEGPVGLGFTRLSIVDPEGGDQPLSTEDGSVVLIANGEIYNHRELEAGLPAGTRMTTDSDCEVLLHLYRRDGVHFLDSVRGIYAVVLWDRARSRLVFARDRFGVKPLHYARRGAELTFASEIKAIFANPDIPRDERVVTAVRELVDDHAEDEGRHHAFFSKFFDCIWPQLSARQRRLLGPFLPRLVLAFLEPDYDALASILSRSGLSDDEVRRVIEEAHPHDEVVADIRRTSRATLRLFHEHDILDDPGTLEAFSTSGLLGAT